jgi:hypothetical protein
MMSPDASLGDAELTAFDLALALISYNERQRLAPCRAHLRKMAPAAYGEKGRCGHAPMVGRASGHACFANGRMRAPPQTPARPCVFGEGGHGLANEPPLVNSEAWGRRRGSLPAAHRPIPCRIGPVVGYSLAWADPVEASITILVKCQDGEVLPPAGKGPLPFAIPLLSASRQGFGLAQKAPQALKSLAPCHRCQSLRRSEFVPNQ